MSIHNRQAQAELQPPPSEHLEALTKFLWDDEESLNKLHEAVSANSTDDNSGSGAPNNQAGLYSKSDNDAALMFGICFTTLHNSDFNPHHDMLRWSILRTESNDSRYSTILYYSLIKLIIETSYGLIQNASKAFSLPSYSSYSYQ